MMEKYNVDGDLYWSTTYWAQNPWETTMSYNVSDNYEFGNGDGRLLYPPTKAKPSKVLIKPPITSIRFELIREGLEDKEYFYLLQHQMNIIKQKNNTKFDKYIVEGEKSLHLINALVGSLFSFESNPKKLYEVRFKIAKTLEKLVNLKI